MDKDTINRQQAIDSVQGIGRLATLPDNDAVIRMSAVEYVLYNLPPVQPERKTGKWICIDNGDGFPDWLCSECGNSGRGDYSYCPWCNADMREGQDEYSN